MICDPTMNRGARWRRRALVAAADEDTACRTAPRSKMKIGKLKGWLTEQNHEERAWQLAQAKAKTPAFVAATREVLGARPGLPCYGSRRGAAVPKQPLGMMIRMLHNIVSVESLFGM